MGAVYRQVERPYLWVQGRFEKFSPSLLFVMATAAGLLGLLGAAGFVQTLLDRELVGTVFTGAFTALAVSVAVRWGSTARTVLWARRSFGTATRGICGGRESGPVVSSPGRVLIATDDELIEVAARLLRHPELLRQIPYSEIASYRVTFDEIEIGTAADEHLSWVGIPPSQSAEIVAALDGNS
jgi:hypothetical protein